LANYGLWALTETLECVQSTVSFEYGLSEKFLEVNPNMLGMGKPVFSLLSEFKIVNKIY